MATGETSEGKSPPSIESERLARIAIAGLLRHLPKDEAPVDTEAVRAIEVLLHVAAARPNWLADSTNLSLAGEIVPRLADYDPEGGDPEFPEDETTEERLLWHCRCCLIGALNRLLDWSPSQRKWSQNASAGLASVKATAAERLCGEAETLVAELLEKDDFGSSLHPFFIHQLIGALQTIETKPWQKSPAEKLPEPSSDALFDDAHDLSGTLQKLLGSELEKLLAKHQLGLDNAGDSVALAFGSAAVALVEDDSKRYTRASLAACLASYRRSAGWEQGRVVCQGADIGPPRRRMSVLGAEVYAAVGEAACDSRDENRFLEDGEDSAPAAVLELLEVGLRLADDSKVDGPSPRGWAADQILGSEEVELGATAAVLDLALVADELHHRQRRQSVLKALDAKASWGDDWPSFLNWETYREKSDPELANKQGILRFIDAEIVQPRVEDPGRAQSKPVITLLFGPPGTTKTTIARAVAGGLRWPLVTLSPGDFIKAGLEKVEDRATLIFDQLEQLSRAVVIFDECDELFRKREPEVSIDSFRNVSAFITASMLPKLQDLHDRGRIVVFICTNFLDSIDYAMRRIGRIDHLIAVPPPDDAQRLATIREELRLDEQGEKNEKELGYLPAGARKLASGTEHFIRGELINAARELRRVGPFASVKEANAAARQISERKGTIDPESKSYLAFKKDLKELSEPHRRGEEDDE